MSSINMRNNLRISAIALTAAIISSPLLSNSVLADEYHNHSSGPRADGHAPIGVMGDHIHKKGEWMLSYRFMHMDMQGNQKGKDNISPDTIVTSIPNRFGPPATLRVVPTEMQMDMHMLGAMFAPTDNITLMAMLPILDNEMKHITYQGMMGTNQLGTFKTTSKGIGDLKLSALYGLYNDGTTKIHFNAGMSVPTGSITRQDEVLTPMNTRMTVRLPYAMQLGTGTWDLMPGLTMQSHHGDFSFGAQYMARFHLGDNDEGYSRGDKHELTGWVAYQWANWISTSLRVTGKTEQEIDGLDSAIALPVQTADPDNYGGEKVDLALGVNLVGQTGAFKGHRLALEVSTPIYQDLNGVQMEQDFSFTIGWQKAF